MEMQTSGQLTFIDKDIIYPGDTAVAEVKIASPQLFKGMLTEGMRFEFREGAIVIGTGQITRILNESLRKQGENRK